MVITGPGFINSSLKNFAQSYTCNYLSSSIYRWDDGLLRFIIEYPKIIWIYMKKKHERVTYNDLMYYSKHLCPHNTTYWN